MIRPEDLDRLITEISTVFQRNPNPEMAVADWLEDQAIGEDAISHLTSNLQQLWMAGTLLAIASDEMFSYDEASEALQSNISASCLMAFVIGWEASRQYGRRSE